MEISERVTRNDLREIHVGQTRIWAFEDAKKVTSARVTARQLALEEGYEFQVNPDYLNRAVCIKRLK